MKMKSKKAVEWPSTLIYVIFANILLLIGVIILVDLAALAGVDADFYVYKLQHDIVAHRIINSHGCMAHSEVTPTGTQVYAGVLDWDTTDQDLINCLGGHTGLAKVTLKDLEQGDEKKLGPDEIRFRVSDIYFVKIHRDNELHNGHLTISTEIRS